MIAIYVTKQNVTHNTYKYLTMDRKHSLWANIFWTSTI